MGTKERYNDKWHMEVPNSDEPFFNVEKGLKISLSTVYIMLQNRSHISQKILCKIMAYKRDNEASARWGPLMTKVP